MFGLLKMGINRTEINCYDDLVDTVPKTTPGGFNKVIPGTSFVCRKWDTYFKGFHQQLKGISQFHHFVFENGSVKCEFVDSPEKIFNLKLCDGPTSEFLEIVLSTGLSIERQWYLYKNIRNLCRNESSMDKVAPKPESIMKNSDDEDDLEPVLEKSKTVKIKEEAKSKKLNMKKENPGKKSKNVKQERIVKVEKPTTKNRKPKNSIRTSTPKKKAKFAKN